MKNPSFCGYRGLVETSSFARVHGLGVEGAPTCCRVCGAVEAPGDGVACGRSCESSWGIRQVLPVPGPGWAALPSVRPRPGVPSPTHTGRGSASAQGHSAGLPGPGFTLAWADSEV